MSTRTTPLSQSDRRLIGGGMFAAIIVAFFAGVQLTHFHPEIGWTPPIGQLSLEMTVEPVQ
ncbi:MAG: hypothetical protein AAB737_02700 [Patescibacteria group bacterium]